MKTLILTAMLALTAVSGVVVTSQPADAGSPLAIWAAGKLTTKTMRPQVLDLGPRFVLAAKKAPACDRGSVVSGSAAG
jgi:hypothetical protein